MCFLSEIVDLDPQILTFFLNVVTFSRIGSMGLKVSLASFHAPSNSSVLMIGLVSLSASSMRSATATSGD